MASIPADPECAQQDRYVGQAVLHPSADHRYERKTGWSEPRAGRHGSSSSCDPANPAPAAPAKISQYIVGEENVEFNILLEIADFAEVEPAKATAKK